MSTQRKHERLGGPGYWPNETSGALEPIVKKYLDGGRLTPAEIATMGVYLWQWVVWPGWDQNPSGDPRGDLAGLRRDVNSIRTQEDIEAWLDRAVDLGIDPL